MNRIPRTDQAGVKFPKMKKQRTAKKKAKTPESTIQAIADVLLQSEGIPYMRFPDSFFRSIFANPQIPVWTKKHLKDALSGWADNVLFMPVGEYKGVKLCLSAHMENKTSVGKFTGLQKMRDKELGYNICRDETDIRNVIEKFKFFSGMLKSYLDNLEGKE